MWLFGQLLLLLLSHVIVCLSVCPDLMYMITITAMEGYSMPCECVVWDDGNVLVYTSSQRLVVFANRND